MVRTETAEREALIRTAASKGPGAEDAFTALVDIHRPRVVSFIAGLLGDRDQAEDVAQGVFLKAHGALSGFRFDARFDSWLFRIAYRAAIDHTRKGWWRRRVRLDAMTEPGREEALAGLSGAAGSGAPPDPEESVLREERARRVRHALRAIPMAYRAPLALKDLADLPYEEIARILGCPLGTVESRIHRGRLALRRKLGKVLP
ncbi:MAG: RNA polymerase sigma factor [Myxococcota bacterium]